MSDYPPGTLGYALEELQTKIDALPWFLRWWFQRDLDRTKAKLDKARNETIERYRRGEI